MQIYSAGQDSRSNKIYYSMSFTDPGARFPRLSSPRDEVSDQIDFPWFCILESSLVVSTVTGELWCWTRAENVSKQRPRLNCFLMFHTDQIFFLLDLMRWQIPQLCDWRWTGQFSATREDQEMIKSVEQLTWDWHSDLQIWSSVLCQDALQPMSWRCWYLHWGLCTHCQD